MARGRVLVAGSLPSPDSDLDLLVGPGDRELIERGLAAAGFEGRSGVWVRFESREVVDLTDVGAWALDPSEADSLFADAVPIEPLGRVCRPAPHHTLLILARRAMRDGRSLRPARATRIAAELARDPAAFERAHSRARAWGAGRSLAAIERAYRDPGPIPASTRRRAIAEELSGSRGRRRAAVAAWRAVLRRPRWGRLVHISCPDPAARGRQADELAALLDKIGFEVARLGSGSTAADLYGQMLKGRVIVRDGPADAPAGGTARGVVPLPAPLIVHRLDPDSDEGEQRMELARRTWAALAS